MHVGAAPRYAVLLIDVNPIADATQPLLFDWQQLPYARGATGDATGAAAGDAAAAGAAAAAAAEPRQQPEEQQQEQQEQPEQEQEQPPRSWAHVPLLVVEDAAAVRPGGRTACAMPYDMLALQERDMGDLIRLMREQRAPGDGGSDDGSESASDDDGSAGGAGASGARA